MATSKTLAPTNVTISIPAMTDQPNASVLANCADKEADAINALNSQIGRCAMAITHPQHGTNGNIATFTFSGLQQGARIGVIAVCGNQNGAPDVHYITLTGSGTGASSNANDTISNWTIEVVTNNNSWGITTIFYSGAWVTIESASA